MTTTAGRHAKVWACAGAAALALGGCGSGATTKARPLPSPPKPSGEAAKPAPEILSDARSALLQATSVRVVGHLTGRAAPTGSSASAGTLDQRFDLRLSRGPKGAADATGTVTTVTTVAGKVSRVQLSLIRVANTVYLKGDKSYYARIGPKAAAVAGHWLSLPISGDRALADLTDMDTFANGLSASSGTNLGLHKLGAVPAVVVRTSAGALLYVAGTGEPQALRLQRPASTTNPASSTAAVLGGTLDFSDYGAAVSVTAPAGAVSLAKLR